MYGYGFDPTLDYSCGFDPVTQLQTTPYDATIFRSTAVTTATELYLQ
jgi:hypothetical protein